MAKSPDVCMPAELRPVLETILESMKAPKDSTKAALTMLDEIPDCKAKGAKAKGTRAPSAYNVHIGACMKRIGKSVAASERMKRCAVEWKARKGSK